MLVLEEQHFALIAESYTLIILSCSICAYAIGNIVGTGGGFMLFVVFSTGAYLANVFGRAMEWLPIGHHMTQDMLIGTLTACMAGIIAASVVTFGLIKLSHALRG
jgi:hypothetical protein